MDLRKVITQAAAGPRLSPHDFRLDFPYLIDNLRISKMIL